MTIVSFSIILPLWRNPWRVRMRWIVDQGEGCGKDAHSVHAHSAHVNLVGLRLYSRHASSLHLLPITSVKVAQFKTDRV
jgi:hypothetical protein